MNDINEIKKRINQRKINKNKKKLNDKNFSKVYNFMIKSMVIIFVLLTVFTYVKVTPEGYHISEYVLSNKHFNNLMSWINMQFYDFFPNTHFMSVSSVVDYTHINDNLYTNNSNEVINFEKGRVIYKGVQDLLGNYLIVLFDNNIEVTFGGMTDIFVSEYDSVEKGTVIGTYNDHVIMIFSHGGKEIDYETFKKLIK